MLKKFCAAALFIALAAPAQGDDIQDSIAAALEAYGLDRCGQSGAALLIGLGPASFSDPPVAQRLAAPPEAPGDIHFLDAPSQVDLIAALLASPEAERVVDLHIGSCLDWAKEGRFDYREAVSLLGTANLPALTHLTLGEMFLTFNGHPYFGRIGDVAPVLDAVPTLEHLDLFGQFEWSLPVSHAALRELSAQVDEVGVTGGPPSQDAVTHLLSSTLPALIELDLDLDDGGDDTFALPMRFPGEDAMPALRRVNMTNLGPEDEARLAAWHASRR